MKHFIPKALLAFFWILGTIYCFTFNKVVIWGHKLHTHTHSYVHNAFYKAFKYLEYPTYWFDNATYPQTFDFSQSLFITEGQVDQNIPLRKDCRYILHNCYSSKYQELLQNGCCINLQVYTDDVLQYPNLIKIDECIYYDLSGRCIYMPWATDLLPHEIEKAKIDMIKPKDQLFIWWIGTIGDGKFGNIHQINPFKQACAENNIPFLQKINLSIEENKFLIQHSFMAPTIVGTWQLQKGYVPCRIFKNISYGQMGITNSSRVYELFQKKIIYNPDTYQLFYDAQQKIKNLDKEELYELMDFVKNNHTYLNRIETLLAFLQLVEETYGIQK